MTDHVTGSDDAKSIANMEADPSLPGGAAVPGGGLRESIGPGEIPEGRGARTLEDVMATYLDDANETPGLVERAKGYANEFGQWEMHGSSPSLDAETCRQVGRLLLDLANTIESLQTEPRCAVCGHEAHRDKPCTCPCPYYSPVKP